MAESHARTVAESHASTVAEPDARTVAEPDAATVAEPDASTVAESHAATVATKLLDREVLVTDPDVRRAFGIQFRRLAKPSNMRGIIDLLVTRRELRDDIHRFLQRQGEPAADLLVEMLVAAEGAAARRAYRDAILKCPSAVEPLMHLLRDHRWFLSLIHI